MTTGPVPPGDFEWDLSDVPSSGGSLEPTLSGSAGGSVEESWRRRAAGLTPGSSFAGFLLVEPLGRGGTGVVYRARELASGREVALKVLARGRMGPTQLERFRREGELTASLSHPGIVRVHSAGEADGLPFLAYELIPGGRSLEHELRGCSPARAVALVQEVVAAIAHAHERGVVHRDLKPSNVLIDAAGRARVADFGLALTTDQDRMTQTGALLGTPSYMSPEQVAGRREVGPASDVWSLGVILYQALTGRLPFASRSFYELAAQVLEARPTPPRQLAPEVSPGLEAVCLRALTGDAGRRYPDAGAMALELARALGGERVPAVRPGRAGALVATALALLVVTAGVLVLRGRELGASDERARVEQLIPAVRRDPARRQELVEALDRGGTRLPPTLRAAGLLVLAAGAPGAEERLCHALTARSLAPGPEPARVVGETLLELGRPVEAVEALREASQAHPADPELLIALGGALLGAARPADASEVIQRLREQFPGRPEGEELELRALAAREGVAAGLAAVDARQRRGAEPARELARARIIADGGGDPLPALRAASERWTDSPALRRTLLEELFVRGELEELLVRCETWARRSPLGAELVRLRRAAEDLLADPALTPVPQVAPPQRAAAVRWLLETARREVAMALRFRWPVLRPQWAGTYCQPDAHAARARARLGQLLRLEASGASAGRAHLLLGRLLPAGSAAQREEAATAARLLPGDRAAMALRVEAELGEDPAGALAWLEATWPGEAWRGDPQLARLRGQALLSLERPGEAVEPLQVAWGAEQLSAEVGSLLADALERAGLRAAATKPRGAEQIFLNAVDAVGKASDADEVRERVARLLGSRREEAWGVFLVARDGLKDQPEARHAAYRRALELDPTCEEARFCLARERGRALEYEGALRELLLSIRRLPYLYLSEVSEELRGLSSLVAGGRTNLREALARLGDAPGDRLLRCFLIVTMVEYEDWRSEDLALGLREVDAHLAEHPEEVFAWTMRGFLHLRAGLLPQAGRDLGIARECAPESPAFYLALLAAARGAPAEEVLQQLQDAFRRGYPRGNVEAFPRYPELVPYLRDRRFRERVAKLGER